MELGKASDSERACRCRKRSISFAEKDCATAWTEVLGRDQVRDAIPVKISGCDLV